ncbi:response regulator [Zooshikella marina]|uniref:Response regulator n=1 Tax=Zooshikella ganghwensis TaxID=202772 RepID=A0A4P9VS41_9GAMM|nr:response regulator [Zooshikella ganghwensis]MBU2705948.1 response regulator [Zooshikella ganghwensis]RDH46438.1 response regulator [Zooshikella ganghwensis]
MNVNKLSVLIIDDQQEYQTQIKNILNKLSITNITVCENGNIGLSLLRNKFFKFDLAITDWCMPLYSRRTIERLQKQLYRDSELRELPIKNGIDFCHYVRNDTALYEMRLILCSACLDVEKQQGFIKSGVVDACLKHPPGLEEIKYCLSKWYSL